MKNAANWMYDGHQEAMEQAVKKTPAIKKGVLSKEYAASLYLLTGLESAWSVLQKYVNRDGIDHKGMLDEPLSEGERLIVGLAGNLFNGGIYIDFTPIDLIDSLDGAMLVMAINGILLRRGTLTAAI